VFSKAAVSRGRPCIECDEHALCVMYLCMLCCLSRVIDSIRNEHGAKDAELELMICDLTDFE
jgi:hypothetical protein